MKFTCPKCGKAIELTTDALVGSGYRTVCPQCLSALQIVGQYAYIPADDGTLDLAPARQEPPTTTPPPLPPDTDSKPDTAYTHPNTATPPDNTDPLLPEVIRWLGGCVSVTPMTIANRFGIPLERAQQIINQLERAGIIGPYNNGGPRTILIPHAPTSVHTPLRGTGQVLNNASTAATPNSEPNIAPPTQRTYHMSCGGCLLWAIIAAFAVEILRHIF